MVVTFLVPSAASLRPMDLITRGDTPNDLRGDVGGDAATSACRAMTSNVSLLVTVLARPVGTVPAMTLLRHAQAPRHAARLRRTPAVGEGARPAETVRVTVYVRRTATVSSMRTSLTTGSES